jgi:hypothetical protein
MFASTQSACDVNIVAHRCWSHAGVAAAAAGALAAAAAGGFWAAWRGAEHKHAAVQEQQWQGRSHHQVGMLDAQTEELS